ncbi:MAG TPA: hypothetical protein VKK31_28075 [Thermoanaerobaculia bacterium]|nr:hypothetical protein [Thermoanaerobaculia bacterium]
MNNTPRWIALVGALLLAVAVGFAAWQAGVAHGIEQSGKIVVAPSGPNPGPYPYPYPYYGWHRPWGFGFLFVPLFFFFWFFVVRGLFWRRAWYGGGCGPRGRFDEWHRQAHARGTPETAEAVPGAMGER